MRSATICCGLLLLAGAASAQVTETETQKLLPAGYQFNDGIGHEIAAGGDWFFLSAIGDAVTEGQQGAVHAYHWSGDGWVEDGLIVASEPSGFSQFGSSMAFSGDTFIVGAPRQDNPGFFNQGMAYAFRLEGETWVEEAQLFPTGFSVGTFYAEQVALGGGRVFVLGDVLDGLGGKTATIFIFRRTNEGWVQEAPFQHPSLTQSYGNYQFIAATEEQLFLGLGYEDGPAGVDQGAVLIFEHDGSDWTLTTTLHASDALAGDRFGTTLELEGNRLAVGAPVKSYEVGDLRGAVYVFRQEADTWVEELATSTQAPENTGLGNSVDLEGSLLFAGAGSYDSPAGTNVGAVYAWHRSGTTWTPLGLFVSSDGESQDLVGQFIAASGPMVMAGAPNDGPPVVSFDVHGSGYAFDALSQGWRHRGGSSAGIAGHPVLTAFGEPSPGSIVTIELQRAAPAAPVFLVAGFTALDVPFKGGVLVPFPHILLAGMGTNAAGELIVSGHWPALPSGTTLYIQDWVVDPSATSGLAGSNGVAALVP